MDIRKKYRLLLSGVLLVCLTGLGVLNYVQIRDRIPDSYIQTEGEPAPDRVSPLVSEEIRADMTEASANAFSSGGYTISYQYLGLIPMKETRVEVREPVEVIPGGIPIGIYLETRGILIIGTGTVTGADGLNYEPALRIVRGGDYIRAVNGQEVSEKEELIEAVSHAFCASCNRVRLTSTGLLKPCLCYETGSDLKPLLRGGADDKVLLHELLHLNYFDAAQGIFWCLIRALHWCDPFMHYVLDRVGNDLESLCDQRVLERLEGEERREYGGILLGMANAKYARAPGTSSISNGGKNISRRIAAIVRFKLYPRGMALASVCIVLVLAAPLLLGSAGTDIGHMYPNELDGLDRSLAAARTTRCRTPAAALDTYAKGLIYDNGVFLAAASPFEKHGELYEGMRASRAEGWVAYHYESVPEQYAIDSGSGYLINNLVCSEGVCEAELILTVNYVADLENGGWLKDADGDTLTGLYVVPVRAWEAEGWVVEETGERQFIAPDGLVYDPVSLARWGNDILPWRDTVSVERECGTVTLRRNLYAVAADSSMGLAGVPQGYSDSIYRPEAVFRTMAELLCVEYTSGEDALPQSWAKLEMLPLRSADEEYAFDGTEYESIGLDPCEGALKASALSEEFDGWRSVRAFTDLWAG